MVIRLYVTLRQDSVSATLDTMEIDASINVTTENGAWIVLKLVNALEMYESIIHSTYIKPVYFIFEIDCCINLANGKALGMTTSTIFSTFIADLGPSRFRSNHM